MAQSEAGNLSEGRRVDLFCRSREARVPMEDATCDALLVESLCSMTRILQESSASVGLLCFFFPRYWTATGS
jgi:hypothetical protein